MNGSAVSWIEPVVRVQSLAQTGITAIPDRYIKPPFLRPDADHDPDKPADVEIPVIDFGDLVSADNARRESALRSLSEACREWGFFQIINHGVSEDLMNRAKVTWREFFELAEEEKEEYANCPTSYEGYGSRTGVEKGAILDWGDYYYLYYSPPSVRNPNKWPISSRKIIGEYGEEMLKLSGKMMRMLSMSLGLKEDHLHNAFGGEDMEGCIRANFYPKCPQPHLTLGCSSHSDPGCFTLVLPDDHVAGLQIHKSDAWINVKTIPNTFVVNIGDQTQLVSNGMYKSVNHRVKVNSEKERITVAFFYNPKSNLVIEPAGELISEERPALYPPITFNQYKLHIRSHGLCTGTTQIEALSTLQYF